MPRLAPGMFQRLQAISPAAGIKVRPLLDCTHAERVRLKAGLPRSNEFIRFIEPQRINSLLRGPSLILSPAFNHTHAEHQAGYFLGLL